MGHAIAQAPKGTPNTPPPRLKSGVFSNGGGIPKRYSGEGEDLSPPIQWVNLPEDAAELALIVDDPDASTTEPWVHWVIYKIMPEEPGLAEGLPRSPKLEDPTGALQGKNSFGSIGYRGPCPPKGGGTHRYRFNLYALSKELPLTSGLDKNALLKAMRPYIIAQAEIIGVYRRD